MSSKFTTLATEIIELIATFVEPADLRSLRLVCRELYRKTLDSFGIASFTTIHTDLSYQSLERIESISGSEHYAIHVRCLHIENSPDGVMGQGFDWPRHFSGCLAGNLDGANLLRDLLSQRLHNCRSSHIDPYLYDEPSHDISPLMSGDAIGIILSIVAEGDLAFRSFTIQDWRKYRWSLESRLLQIPLSQTPKFLKPWSQIEELGLDYALRDDQWDWVLHLISSAPNLRKLSLGACADATSFEQRLSSMHKLKGLAEPFHGNDTSFLQRLSSIDELKRLEELRLGSTWATENALTSLLLRNSHTLHSLSLQHIPLVDEGTWAAVLEIMRSRLLQLQNLELFWLKWGFMKRFVVIDKLMRYP